jgi:hypothetical protein
MKKFNSILGNEKVQGNLIVAVMILLIAAIMIFTWGK